MKTRKREMAFTVLTYEVKKEVPDENGRVYLENVETGKWIYNTSENDLEKALRQNFGKNVTIRIYKEKNVPFVLDVVAAIQAGCLTPLEKTEKE